MSKVTEHHLGDGQSHPFSECMERGCIALRTPEVTSGNGTPLPKSSGKPLLLAERKEFQKLIERRQKTILTSLENELSGDEDVVNTRVRMEKGITLSSEQLDQLIISLNEQIKSIVERNLPGEKKEIEIAMHDIDEDIDEKISVLKEQMRTQVQSLENQRKKDKESLKEKMKTAEERVAFDFAKDLVTKRDELAREMNRVSTLEIEMKSEVLQRLSMIRQSKGRIKDMVMDASGRALEDLMTATTAEEANALVKRIPTVSEAMECIKSREGLHKLYQMLDPNIAALPPPDEENPSIEIERTYVADDVRDRHHVSRWDIDRHIEEAFEVSKEEEDT